MSTSTTVYVGSFVDGPVQSCSGLATGGSLCNLRSAWAICVNNVATFITSTACTASHQSVACDVVLPAGSQSSVKASVWGELSIAALLLAAHTTHVLCPIALTLRGASSANRASIVGDGAPARLLNVAGNSFLGSTLSLSLSNVVIGRFGTGTTVIDGGCVQASQLASVAIASSSFYACTAINGGAVYLGSIGTSTTVTASNFSNNLASYPSGFEWNSGNYYAPADYKTGDGGAIFVSYCSNVAVTGSKFYNNVASDSGGAIYYNMSSQVTLTSSTFVGNSALSGWGGGALMYRYTTTMVVRNCTFANQVLPGPFPYGGGAVGVYYSSGFTVDLSTFTGNAILQAGGGGGAIILLQAPHVSITRTVFIGNTALQNGGAITFYSGCNNVVINHCVFQRNRLDTTKAGVADTALGGALMFEGMSDAIIENTVFDHNSAIGGGAVGRPPPRAGPAPCPGWARRGRAAPPCCPPRTAAGRPLVTPATWLVAGQ